MSALRWVLFLPLALGAAVLGSFVFSLLAAVFHNQTVINGVGAFVFTFLFVFSAGLLAPSKRSQLAMAVGAVLAVLAILSFLLALLGVEVFAERGMPDQLSIPVLQVLGVLYAIFLVPPCTVPGTTRERFWREIIALGAVVTMLGLVLAVAGLVTGMITRSWATLAVGGVVLAMGVATWLFPHVHLTLRLGRMPKI
ncbi:MAG: hypothetical protein IH983_08030 [Planctomycetes bacterium]|nr:hypothetical protein [Planctomycetota bacterium]